MTDILSKIEAYKRREIEEAKANMPLSDVEKLINQQSSPRGFRRALLTAREENRPSLIAEIKKASPSKGLIRADFDPAKLAQAYAAGGADCLSVLTDVPSFMGHPDYLQQARACVSLPVLRKDFMFDVYQVYEARAWGADAILIILSAVDDTCAAALYSCAKSLGMDALCEIHDLAELERAQRLGMDLIGVNNRNLKTFETSLQVSLDLIPKFEPNSLMISESGIFTATELYQLYDAGAHGFLVGESLMRQSDITDATRKLLQRVS